LISWSLNFGCTLDSPEHSVADFAIYPNPNNGNFTISYPSVSAGDINVMVHDMRGRKIFENSYSNSGNFNQEIALDRAQAGVYLVTLQQGDAKIVKRIVVEIGRAHV